MSKKIHPDDKRTISLYQKLLEEHGETYRALDWGSRESQQKRFEVLAGIGVNKGDRILDVGCGLADFNAWLIENRPGVEYAGIDLTPGMVERAQTRFPNSKILNKTIFDKDLPVGPLTTCLRVVFFFSERKIQKNTWNLLLYRCLILPIEE